MDGVLRLDTNSSGDLAAGGGVHLNRLLNEKASIKSPIEKCTQFRITAEPDTNNRKRI